MVIPKAKVAKLEGFPVDKYSYSMLAKACTNPVLFRIQYLNHDTIDTTRSSTSVLGQGVHAGLKAFLGGDDRYPVMVKDTDSVRLKYALDAALEYLRSVPDGFIDWKKSVPTRGVMEEKALLAIPGYVREWDRTNVKEILLVEKELKHAVRLTHGSQEIELPVPLHGYPDCVYESAAGEVCIDDHKMVSRFSDPDAVDGSKLIQAAMYFLLVYAELGRRPYKMTFREYKITENADKSSQSREYTIIYDEMSIVFDMFFRLYGDVTRMLLGEAVFLPNIMAMYDRDVALLAYIYRLDEPEQLKKEMKKMRAGDVAHLMQKKMARTKSLKKFAEAKASLFSSSVSLDYSTMNAQEKIKYKFFEHGIPLDFSDKIDGPGLELYRFRPTMGVKMSTLEKYRKDVEQILSAEGVRILAPIPGTDLIGFEVPKKKRVYVRLSEAKKTPCFEIPLGVDVYGTRYDLDLKNAPHVLIGGTTGSGKSGVLESMITFLTRLPKHEVRFALADPKLVELSQFQDDMHTDRYEDDPEKIADMMREYVVEMNCRYALFKKSKVKDLESYREKIAKDLPRIVIVIDEFADIVMQGGAVAKVFKENMILLAQKARASGIHVIAATQRPDSKVVDGLIKANFPTRIALRTVSSTNSEIILDRGGAELLQGNGDMLVSHNGKIDRLQGYQV